MAVPVSYSSMGYFQSSMPHPRHAWHDDQMSGEPPAGQQDVIVILAFISGASFISLIIILAVFALCRFGNSADIVLISGYSYQMEITC